MSASAREQRQRALRLAEEERLRRQQELEQDEGGNDDDDDERKQDEMKKPTGTGLKTLLLVIGIILIVSGIVQIILGATVDNSTISLQTITVFRSGVAATNRTIDSFPATVVTPLNNINMTLVYGFAQAFGGIGMLLLSFLFDKMVGEQTYGANGYMWGGLLIATTFYNVVIAIRCGMQDLTVLIFDGTLHAGVIFILWLGDLLNQLFYRNTLKRLGVGRFSYAFLIMAIITFVVVWGMQVVALVMAVHGVNGAPNIALVTPLLALFMYVLLFVFIGLYYGEVGFISETYDRDLWLAVVVFVTLLVVPWVDVILFFTTTFVGA
jgi:hypothetical protein